jgi:hypothetical protein
MPQREKRALCPCGGRNTVRVVIEYIRIGDASVQYAGGRFCYFSNALIDITIPADAIPVQASIYDLHEPDEIIRITFTLTQTPDESRRGSDVPGKAGEDNHGRIAPDRDGGPARATTTRKPTTPTGTT